MRKGITMAVETGYDHNLTEELEHIPPIDGAELDEILDVVHTMPFDALDDLHTLAIVKAQRARASDDPYARAAEKTADDWRAIVADEMRSRFKPIGEAAIEQTDPDEKPDVFSYWGSGL